MAADYREEPPPPALAAVVHCLWSGSRDLTDAGDPFADRVVPDGCTDLIWSPGTIPFVAGPDRGPQLLSLSGPTRFFGIRFRPGTGRAAIGHPPAALVDQQVPVDQLWPAAAARRLTDQLEQAGSTQAVHQVLTRVAAARFQAGPDPDELVGGMARAVAASVGVDRARPSPADTGVGERQARRRFVAEVGYGPKRFERVMRLQRFLALASGPKARSEGLAQVAVEAGYSDQSHLNRDCVELTGLTPARVGPR